MTIILWKQFFLFFVIYFSPPLIHNFWRVGGDYTLLLDLRGFVVLQNLIIMCIFVALNIN